MRDAIFAMRLRNADIVKSKDIVEDCEILLGTNAQEKLDEYVNNANLPCSVVD